MKALATKGAYDITDEMKANLADFIGGWASENETQRTIHKIYSENGYVIDTHTAVAASVYYRYAEETADAAKTVIVSTASPYKFAKSVLGAIRSESIPEDDFEQAEILMEVSKTQIPKAVEEIRLAPVLHNQVYETCDMQKAVENILKII
jgi:threonine synthase